MKNSKAHFLPTAFKALGNLVTIFACAYATFLTFHAATAFVDFIDELVKSHHLFL